MFLCVQCLSTNALHSVDSLYIYTVTVWYLSVILNHMNYFQAVDFVFLSHNKRHTIALSLIFFTGKRGAKISQVFWPPHFGFVLALATALCISALQVLCNIKRDKGVFLFCIL